MLATCAKRQSNTRSFAAIRAMIGADKPVMLLFGTAWGLSPDVMEMVDGVLPPLQGATPFNHLSVRARSFDHAGSVARAA